MYESENHPIDILSDHPIDYAFHFNFKEYADSITKTILNPYNYAPFTIVINGQWGSGKTSLMKTIQKKLESDEKIWDGDFKAKKVKTIWFDAWKYSEKDSLLSALALEIYENVVNDKCQLFGNSFWKIIQKKLGLWSKSLNKAVILEDFLKFSLSSISLVSGTPPLKYENFSVSKWVDSPVDKTKLSYYSKFNEYLDTIINAYLINPESNEKGNLIIFIDDLDRCPPRSVTEILESINLFFDKGQCIFVLGMDMPKVSKIIENYYDKYSLKKEPNDENINRDSSFFSGDEYLKKMVQIQLNLPKLHDEDIKDYIEKEMRHILPKLDFSDLILRSLSGTNIRELKRFYNTLILIIEIKNSTKRNIRFNVDDELLVKWQLIQFFSPNLIDIIEKNPSFLLALNDCANDSLLEDPDINYGISDELVGIFNNYCKNPKLIDILRYGEKSFDIDSIDECIYLCSFSKLVLGEKGNVTITASGNGRYYFGNKIHFSGTNTISNKTFLLIKGQNLPDCGISLDNPSTECIDQHVDTFSISNVHRDQTWEYVFDTKQYFNNFPEGTYTIYSIAEPFSNPEITQNRYSIVTIVIKNPWITANSDKGIFVIGDLYTITGRAEGSPDNIFIWILGEGEVKYYKVDVDPNGSYKFIFKDPTINSGQHYVIVQHPNVKNLPDVNYKEDSIVSTWGESFSILGKSCSEILEHLVNSLKSQNCSDIFTELSFFSETPWLNIEPIGTKRTGDHFRIRGSTNLAEGNTIFIRIMATFLREGVEITTESHQRTLLVDKGSIDNEWSMSFDTSGFKGSFEIIVMTVSKKISVSEKFEVV